MAVSSTDIHLELCFLRLFSIWGHVVNPVFKSHDNHVTTTVRGQSVCCTKLSSISINYDYPFIVIVMSVICFVQVYQMIDDCVQK